MQQDPMPLMHEVPVEDMFFSITDSRGVIALANDVFVNLSRHELGALLGAPHNLIRHPQMPAGVFAAMWQALEAGEPFGGYVKNLAGDGSRYDVYATVTPLPGGGYLSVRTRPMSQEFQTAAYQIYDQVLELERQLADQGVNRRERAAAGAQEIQRLIQQAGFASYAEFAAQVLPAELAAREQALGGAGKQASAKLQGLLSEWVEQQQALATLAHDLRAATGRLEIELADSDFGFADQQSSQHDGQVLALWQQMQQMGANPLAKLGKKLAELAGASAQTRFYVALAQLHATMVDVYSAEASLTPESQQARELLNDALQSGVQQMQAQTATHAQLAREVADTIEQAGQFLSIPRQLLVVWLQGANQVGENVHAKITARIDQVGQLLDELTRLAAQCREFDSSLDTHPVMEELTKLRAA